MKKKQKKQKKNTLLNRIQTHDPWDMGVVLYQLQLSYIMYQANSELVALRVYTIPVDGKKCK